MKTLQRILMISLGSLLVAKVPHSMATARASSQEDNFVILCEDFLFLKQKKDKKAILTSDWISHCWVVDANLSMKRIFKHSLDSTGHNLFSGIKFAALLDNGSLKRIAQKPRDFNYFFSLPVQEWIRLLRDKPFKKDTFFKELKRKKLKDITTFKDLFYAHGIFPRLFTKDELQEFFKEGKELIEGEDNLEGVNTDLKVMTFLELCKKEREGNTVILEREDGQLMHTSLKSLGIQIPHKLAIDFHTSTSEEDIDDVEMEIANKKEDDIDDIEMEKVGKDNDIEMEKIDESKDEIADIQIEKVDKDVRIPTNELSQETPFKVSNTAIKNDIDQTTTPPQRGISPYISAGIGATAMAAAQGIWKQYTKNKTTQKSQKEHVN